MTIETTLVISDKAKDELQKIRDCCEKKEIYSDTVEAGKVTNKVSKDQMVVAKETKILTVSERQRTSDLVNLKATLVQEFKNTPTEWTKSFKYLKKIVMRQKIQLLNSLQQKGPILNKEIH